jgi:hypothetical protein
MSFLKRIAAAPPRLGTVSVAIASIYLFTAPVEFLTTDGAIRELVAKNLLDHGEVALLQIEEGEIYNRRLWTTGRDGRPYTHFGIGQSLLEIPFLLIYRLAKIMGLIASVSYGGTLPMIGLMVVSSALTCALLFGTVHRLGYSPAAALRVATLAAFATALWVLSRQNFDMVQEALGVVAALYLLLDAREGHAGGRLKLAAAGLCYGMAIVTRISAVVAAPALAWMLLGSSEWGTLRERVRALAWFIAGVAVVGWIVPAYNFARFGSPFISGYENHPPYPGGPLIDGLLRWLVSPWQGVLVYTPFLLALPMVWRRFAREHPHLVPVIVVLFLSYLLFYAQLTGLGLFGWGPYYILPGLLPLVLPFAELFEHWRAFPRWQRGIAVFLIALSVTVQLTSISVPTERYQTDGVLRREPSGENITAIIYNLTWTPIRLQAEATIQNLAHLPDYERYLDTPPDFEPQTLMDELFAYNLPDWWWLFHVLKGGETGLIVPIAAGLGAIWLFTRQGRAIERPSLAKEDNGGGG